MVNKLGQRRLKWKTCCNTCSNPEFSVPAADCRAHTLSFPASCSQDLPPQIMKRSLGLLGESLILSSNLPVRITLLLRQSPIAQGNL